MKINKIKGLRKLTGDNVNIRRYFHLLDYDKPDIRYKRNRITRELINDFIYRILSESGYLQRLRYWFMIDNIEHHAIKRIEQVFDLEEEERS